MEEYGRRGKGRWVRGRRETRRLKINMERSDGGARNVTERAGENYGMREVNK